MIKDSSRIRAGFLPSDVAAISSSRIAFSVRPHGDLTMRSNAQKIMPPKIKTIQRNIAFCANGPSAHILEGFGILMSPSVPPVKCSQFRNTSWIDTAMPKVLTARYSWFSFNVIKPTNSAARPAAIIAPSSPTTNGNSNPPNTASLAGPVRMAIV